MNTLIGILERIDRRIIYLVVAAALATPLIFNFTLPPAPMETADAFYKELKDLKAEPGRIALIAADWGPGTQAENMPQFMSTMEHLMRKRIPFGVISIYQLSDPFLRTLPQKVADALQKEMPGERWEYGKDWVNFGFQPGGIIMIQGLAQSKSILDKLKSDANGTPLSEIPCLKGVTNLKSISVLIEFTGLVGVLSSWIQYFQADGYKPHILHGCTSVSIPDAYNYFASGQIKGLHEGLAGVAWYDFLLSKEFPNRKPGPAQLQNTSLAIAHLVIIAFILLANVSVLRRFSSGGKD